MYDCSVRNNQYSVQPPPGGVTTRWLRNHLVVGGLFAWWCLGGVGGVGIGIRAGGGCPQGGDLTCIREVHKGG